MYSIVRLLRHCVQRVKVAFLFHQFFKAAALFNPAVFHNQNAVIAAQKRLVERVRNHNARYAVQIQQIARHLTRGFRVERGGRLIGEEKRRTLEQAARDRNALLFAAGKALAILSAAIIPSALSQ